MQLQDFDMHQPGQYDTQGAPEVICLDDGERVLLRAAEEWGRAQGCTEFASDADPENAISIDAHLALGFEDAGMVRCFRKSLGD